MLNFLLQLGFRETGRPFVLASLDKTQVTIAAEMAQLGLIMPFKCAATLIRLRHGLTCLISQLT